jgi:hypothetical protein
MTQPVEALVQQWANTPAIRAAGPRLLSVQVAYAAVPVALVETGHGEFELRAHWTAPPELAADPDRLNALAVQTTFARAGQLRCIAAGGAVDIAYPLYLEGLTRNKFYDAATEVAKAAVTIDESVRGAQTTAVAAGAAPVPEPVPDIEPALDLQPEPAPEPMFEPQARLAPEPEPVYEPEPVVAPEPVAAPEPEPERVADVRPVDSPAVPQPLRYSPPGQDGTPPAADVTARQPVAAQPATSPQVYTPPGQSPQAVQQETQSDPRPVEEQPTPQAAPQSVTSAVAPSAPPWAPTHTVPAGGVPAWAAPDPAQPPVTQLPPGLPVRLVERQGGWARVDTENGWSAWVDGRPLPDPPTA